MLVEPRLDVLYQPVFAEQGVDFTVADEHVDVADEVADHPLDFRPAAGQQVGRRLEVAGYARAEALGLADVEDDPGGILEQVNTWIGWQLAERFAQAGEYGGTALAHGPLLYAGEPPAFISVAACMRRGILAFPVVLAYSCARGSTALNGDQP